MWYLFLDDERSPSDVLEHTLEEYVVARSSTEAVHRVIEKGELPAGMFLDHDLGGEDNTMRFLNELHHIWETQYNADPMLIPEYMVHSANPVGAQNIMSFMDTWKKIADLSSTEEREGDFDYVK